MVTPNPEVAAMQRRVKILATVVVGALLFLTLYLAYLMLSSGNPPQNSEPFPAIEGIQTISLEERHIVTEWYAVPAASPSEAPTHLDYRWIELQEEPSHISPAQPAPVAAAGASDDAALKATPLADYEKALPLHTREMLAQLLHGEADIVVSDAERSMVVWTPLNRYDSGIAWFGGDLESIITKAWQFAYDPDAPVTERNLALVNDVVGRWYREKQGETDVGRTLPAHVWFFEAVEGPGWHNTFYWYSNGLYGERFDFGYEPTINPYNS